MCEVGSFGNYCFILMPLLVIYLNKKARKVVREVYKIETFLPWRPWSPRRMRSCRRGLRGAWHGRASGQSPGKRPPAGCTGTT